MGEIRELRFFQFYYDHTFYLDYKGTYIVVYVDDLQIIGPNLDFINHLKSDLTSHFKMINFGLTFYYFRKKFTQNNDTIIVEQIVYINQLLASHQISNYNTATISKVEGLCLVSTSNDFKLLLKNIITYTHFTKSIQWLEYQTQPNII